MSFEKVKIGFTRNECCIGFAWQAWHESESVVAGSAVYHYERRRLCVCICPIPFVGVYFHFRGFRRFVGVTNKGAK